MGVDPVRRVEQLARRVERGSEEVLQHLQEGGVRRTLESAVRAVYDGQAVGRGGLAGAFDSASCSEERTVVRWRRRRRPLLSREQLVFVAVLEAMGWSRGDAESIAAGDRMRAALTGERMVQLAELSAECSARMSMWTASEG